MQIKLTLSRPDGTTDDLRVDADPRASIGAVARALSRRDPCRSGSAAPADTLAVLTGRTYRTLAPATALADAPALSGGTVRLVRADEAGDAADEPPVGMLHVLNGPDRGTSHPLRSRTVVGRGASADIRLDDPLVSREHVRIVVPARAGAGDRRARVLDLNSANGIVIDGQVVRRAEVAANDEFVLGDTRMRVVLHSTDGDPTGASGAYDRSPYVRVRIDGQTRTAPLPPTRGGHRPFPVVGLLVPLALGLVLLLITRSAYAVAFVAMSPLLAVGTWIEGRVSESRSYRRALADHEQELAALGRAATVAEEQERAARRAQHPDPAVLPSAVLAREPMVWSRRPDRPDWLALRVGLGTLPAFNRIALPARTAADPALWERLQRWEASAASISAVPVVAALPELGVLGIAGRRSALTGVIDALLAQLVTLHSPAEVVLAAMTDGAGADRWSWLRWTPHTSSQHSPIEVPHLARDDASGRALLAGIERTISERLAAEGGPAGPAIVLLVDDAAGAERSRLVWIAESGPGVGVHLVHVAVRPDRLVAGCGAYLTVGQDGTGQLYDVRAGEIREPIDLEPLSRPAVETLARGVAPLVDAGAATEAAELPTSVPLLALAGMRPGDAARRVLENWVGTGSLEAPDGRLVPGQHHLSALLGVTANGDLHLDLRAHGPHALVGGTTGAGKSEFLQTWVLGLAGTYSPRRVTFLFVDYKGGAAFGDCTQLPHSVGMITDLTPGLFRRTLVSLRAELRRRERLLADARAKDLLELERRGTGDAFPSLVIVVDEFAALAHDVPEFVDGMVDIAQRGRSLGVHLILATQRPTGVIKDNLRANTNLRVALRMADGADSADVLDAPDAAHISPDAPGRGYVRTGPGRLTAFQTAYAGGHSDGPASAEVAVERLQFGRPDRWMEPETAAAVPEPDEPTDLQVVVSAVREAAASGRVGTPKRPCLPPLRETYRLEDLGPTTGAYALAQRDDPAAQDQYAVGFDPDRDGNLVVHGTGGAGKSTVLRTVAAATMTGAPTAGPTHVYAVDFGAGGLSMLRDLPGVGVVIGGDDTELLARLFRWLTALIAERGERFARAGASTLTEYRERSGDRAEPRIMVLIDGAQVFRQRHEARSGLWEQLLAAAADGRASGIHFCLAADRPSSLPGALNSLLQRRIYLRMSTEDYGLLGLGGSALEATAPPGRGHLDGHEIQVGVLGGDPSIAAQARALRDLAHRAAADLPPPHRIEPLPDYQPLEVLPPNIDGDPVIGLADDTMAPVSVRIRSTFLIAGPPGSGRTTALATVAMAALRSGRYGAAVYFGPRTTEPPPWLSWTAAATDPGDVARLAATVAQALDEPDAVRTLVVVESLPDVATGLAETELYRLAQKCVAAGHALVTDTGLNAKMYSDLAQLIKGQRQGIVLHPGGPADGQNLLFTNTPATGRERRPGRGYLISDGAARLVQVATADPAAAVLTRRRTGRAALETPVPNA